MTCKATISSYSSDSVFNDFLINRAFHFLSHMWCTLPYLALDSLHCGFICEILSPSLSPHTRLLRCPWPWDTGNTPKTSGSVCSNFTQGAVFLFIYKLQPRKQTFAFIKMFPESTVYYIYVSIHLTLLIPLLPVSPS